MKYWFVTVRGLGGPAGEFCSRSYQIHKPTAPEALSAALLEFSRDDNEAGEKWKASFGDADTPMWNKWKPHDFFDANIREGKTIIRIIDDDAKAPT